MENKLTFEQQLEEARRKPVKSKWCNNCGRKVDLRKKGAAAIRYESCIASGIKNREYHFVCSKECYQKMWGR